MTTCNQCGNPINEGAIEQPDGAILHEDCVMQYRAAHPPKPLDPNAVYEIILTTAPTVIGRRMIREIEIITSECVFGSNIFRDAFSGIRDIVGGRAKGQQNILRDAKETCLKELRQSALEIGADAVIAVDLDYQEISGGGKSMLFLVASGTAVELEPISDEK